jgi:hypothetical protein
MYLVFKLMQCFVLQDFMAPFIIIRNTGLKVSVLYMGLQIPVGTGVILKKWHGIAFALKHTEIVFTATKKQAQACFS